LKKIVIVTNVIGLTTKFIYCMYDCIFYSNAGMEDFWLVLGTSHIYMGTHTCNLHMSAGKDCTCVEFLSISNISRTFLNKGLAL